MATKLKKIFLVLLILPCILLMNACFGGDDEGKKMTVEQMKEIMADANLWGTDFIVHFNNGSAAKTYWFNGTGDDMKLKFSDASISDKYPSAQYLYKYFGKVGQNYYEITSYETSGNPTEATSYAVDYIRLTKDECLNIIKTEYDEIFQDFNNIFKENLFQKEKITAYYGADAYTYTDKLDTSGSSNVYTVKTKSIIDEVEFENVRMGVEAEDITTHNLLVDLNYRISYLEDNKFESLECGGIIQSDFDVYHSGQTSVLTYSITANSNPSETLFNMPTFEIDADNEDLDIDKSVVTGDNQVYIFFENCTTLAGISTPIFTDVTLPVPTSQFNFTFDGWYFDSDCKYRVPDNYQASGRRGSITLYAKWQDNFVPTLNLAGGTLESQNNNMIKINTFASRATASKAGHKFLGWFDQNDSNCSGNASQISENMVLTAKWQKQTVVTLNDGGAESKAGKIVEIPGEEVELPANLRKQGKIFAGWFADPDFTTPVSNDYIVPNADITLYAKFNDAYTITQYDLTSYGLALPVSFVIKTNGNEEDFIDLYESITTVYGASDYTGNISIGFAGWYTDSAFTTPFTAYPTSDITLYAKGVNTWSLGVKFVGEDATAFMNDLTTLIANSPDLIINNGILYSTMRDAAGIIPEMFFDLGELNSGATQGVQFWLRILIPFMTNFNINDIYVDEALTKSIYSENFDDPMEVLNFWYDHFEGPLTFYGDVDYSQGPQN